MRYVPFFCRCCKGVWRVRVAPPRALTAAFFARVTGWCLRCGRGDCGKSDECNERAKPLSTYPEVTA